MSVLTPRYIGEELTFSYTGQYPDDDVSVSSPWLSHDHDSDAMFKEPLVATQPPKKANGDKEVNVGCRCGAKNCLGLALFT